MHDAPSPPAPATQVVPEHVAGKPHVPVALHVSTPLFEHCVVPCTQTPLHAPPTHVDAEHATGEPHVPVVLHVSTPLPEHVVDPGLHEPLHWPAVHTLAHGLALPHPPFASQTERLLLWHSV